MGKSSSSSSDRTINCGKIVGWFSDCALSLKTFFFFGDTSMSDGSNVL